MSPPANKRDSPSMLSRLNTSTGSRPASSRNRTSTCTRRGLLPLWQRTGEIPGGSTLIRGAGFLLARGRLRWRTRNTCLSEASCIIFFSSLAVACKPRGTFPESHKHCFLKVPCPANQLKLHENSYFSRKCLTRRNSYVTMFGRMEDIGLFFMLKKR